LAVTVDVVVLVTFDIGMDDDLVTAIVEVERCFLVDYTLLSSFLLLSESYFLIPTNFAYTLTPLAEFIDIFFSILL
jgi:hypothetical protein